MSRIEWFHSFEFPDGSSVAGIRPLARLRAEAISVFSEPVRGKTVLEIGAWDGYFSFEAERRGAAQVHATDHFCWSGPGWGTKAGFDFAHAKLGSRIDATDADVFEVVPERFGTYDVVLFLGVLYHLKNPLQALELLYRLTNEFAVIETHVDGLQIPEPVMRFYLGPELNNDPTNFWAPNLLCLRNMLMEVGFKRLKMTSIDGTLADGRLIGTDGRPLSSGRVIVHASKS
jgi:tRNA (mo5U34)-methyltransferase